MDGWQPLVLNGVQVFDAQQTVARLNLLPAGAAPASAVSRTGEVETDIVTIPPHTLFAGNGGSGPAPEELLPGSVLTRIVVPKKITVHLGKPSANVRNVTVSCPILPTSRRVRSTLPGIARPAHGALLFKSSTAALYGVCRPAAGKR